MLDEMSFFIVSLIIVVVITVVFLIRRYAKTKTASSKRKNGSKVPSRVFYNNWKGHRVQDLERVFESLVTGQKPPVVWLAGDSSLDNKAWVTSDAPACNGYEKVLDPGMSRKDVCYWLNAKVPNPFVAINAAVEASTLGERISDGLLPQDELVRDRIKSDDVLIVSVGGNDFALARSILKVGLMAFAVRVLPYVAQPVAAFAVSKGMKQQLCSFIQKLCERNAPRLIILCTIYYPCKYGSGWPDKFLRWMGYDTDAKSIQNMIDGMHSQVTLPACKELERSLRTQVVGIELSKVLDWKNERHYVCRVEPSDVGGGEMAEEFVRVIRRVC